MLPRNRTALAVVFHGTIFNAPTDVPQLVNKPVKALLVSVRTLTYDSRNTHPIVMDAVDQIYLVVRE